MSADRPINTEGSSIVQTPQLTRRSFLRLAGNSSLMLLLPACAGIPGQGNPAPTEAAKAPTAARPAEIKPTAAVTTAPTVRLGPAPDSLAYQVNTLQQKQEAIETAFKNGQTAQAQKDAIKLVVDGAQLLQSKDYLTSAPKVAVVNGAMLAIGDETLDLTDYTQFASGHAVVETQLQHLLNNKFIPPPFYGEVLSLKKRAELSVSPNVLFLYPANVARLSRYAAILAKSGQLPKWQYSQIRNEYNAAHNVYLANFSSPSEALADGLWQKDPDGAKRFQESSFNRPRDIDPTMVTLIGAGGAGVSSKKLYLATVDEYIENGVDVRRQLKAADIRVLTAEKAIIQDQYDLIKAQLGGQEFGYDALPFVSAGPYHRADITRVVDLMPDLNEAGIPLRGNPTFDVKNRRQAIRLFGVNGSQAVELVDDSQDVLDPQAGRQAITLWRVRPGIVDAQGNFLTYQRGSGEGYLPEEWLGQKVTTNN